MDSLLLKNNREIDNFVEKSLEAEDTESSPWDLMILSEWGES